MLAVGSVRGAPGATTLAVALGSVWPRATPLVVEADADGGVLAARFGLASDPGLTSLAGRARRGLDANDVHEAVQHLPGGLPVVLADPGADVTAAALQAGGRTLAEALAATDGSDVIVDAGRLHPSSPSLALVDRCVLLLVVSRPGVDELAALSRRLPALAERTATLVVLVGDRPYGAKDVAETLGVEVAGVVAHDEHGAAMLGGGTGKGRRNRLLRSVETLAATVAERLGEPAAEPWWADA
jgi:MinD-like ATPase involved in chromosome partitioning or flagellar assembly